jgi:branched-chain amino acid aminotransferase
MTLLTLNGEIADDLESGLSLLDRGFLLGDAVFETVRVYESKAFKLDLHIDRLRQACTRLGFSLTLDVASVASSEIRRAGESGLTNAYFRITVSRGTGSGLQPPESSATVSTIVDTLPEIPASWYLHGIRLQTAKGRRNEYSATAGIKTTAYLDSMLALRGAIDNGADDALLLDTCGHASEATASNIFCVIDGRLLTPPAGCGALPGITRSEVMLLARAQNIQVDDSTPISPTMLSKSSEIFLTSSIREIVPVSSLDGNPVGSGRVGTVTKRLRECFAEVVQCKS